MRALMAIGLAVIAATLIWAGYWVLQAGRDVMAQEARFTVEYFLGSHLLWLLSGVVVAAILNIGCRASARPATPSLAAAIVPILMLLSIYAWGNPATPQWLRQIAVHEWLLSREAQLAAAVLTGVFLGTALWRLAKFQTGNDSVREHA